MKNLFEYKEDERYKEWNFFRVGGVWRVFFAWDKNVNWGWKLERGGSVQGFTAGHLIVGF